MIHTIDRLRKLGRAEGVTVKQFAAKLGVTEISLAEFYHRGWCAREVMMALRRHYPDLYVEAILEWAGMPAMDASRFSSGDNAEPAKAEEPAA